MSWGNRRLAVFGLTVALTLILTLAWTASYWADAACRDDYGKIGRFLIAGKPPSVTASSIVVPQAAIQMTGANVLSDVPAFTWSYGCASTSAAMLFGYYDRIGYDNMYTGTTNSGLCPLDNTIWGPGIGGSMSECPLSATHSGVDNRTAKGHVDDYWVSYGSKANDPYITYGWTEHIQSDCAGDYMGTNQSELGNFDGATYFYYRENGDPLYDYVPGSVDDRDGCHGLRLFAESRGYDVQENYTQLIKGEGTDPTEGFTFQDFMNEIDCGRPVLIHLENHTVLGFGYSSVTGSIYIHDTWDDAIHTMPWGGPYGTADQWGVSVIRLSPIVTGEASEVSAYSATLNGVLISLADDTVAEISFQYGTVPGAYAHTTSTQMLVSPGSFAFDVSGLSGATTYYFRSRLFDGAYAYGNEKDFTTSTLPPEVVTDNVSLVTTSSARLNGIVASIGTADTVTAHFQWGIVSGNYTSNTTSVAMTQTGVFTADLVGLTPGTSYYVRAVAAGHDKVFGEEVVFTTKTLPPVVFTLEASNVSTDSGTFNGRLVSLGTASEVEVFFEWGTTPGFYTDNSTQEVLQRTGYFSFDITGYAPGTTLYFRARAVGHGTDSGNEEAFTTATLRPSVSTIGAAEVGTHSATLTGLLASMGTSSNVTVMFQFGTVPGVYWFEAPPQTASGTGEWTTTIESLSPGTNYYFRAKAAGHGTAYGEEMVFTTSTLAPVIGAEEATEIGHHVATLRAELSDMGTATTVQVLFEYGTSSGLYDRQTSVQSMTEPGEVIYDLHELEPGVTYYFRVKATGHGSVSGRGNNFTTTTAPPSVAGNYVSSVTAYSATLKGEIRSLGSADCLEVTFEWGLTSGDYTNQEPLILLNNAGTATADLTDLSPGTTYYFRIRAVGHGTGYGEERIFTTVTVPPVLASLAEGSATNLVGNSAEVSGELIGLGTASSVTLSLELATVPQGPYQIVDTEIMTNPGPFVFQLPELVSGQTYYLRTKADGGSHGLTYGSQIILVTPDTGFDWALLGSVLLGGVLLVLLSLVFVRAVGGLRTSGRQ